MRTSVGFLAWLVCIYTPLDRLSWPMFIRLLPYAGDWIYREERKQVNG